MQSIETIVGEVTVRLERKNHARDHALVESRQIIRHAANAIRALHRNEFEVARGYLDAGRGMVQSMIEDLADFPDLYWTGYVQDAQKEFAEACLVTAMIRGNEVPGPGDIGVEPAPYLNGLAEAASEMRRYILDSIRRGGELEMREAERILDLMDEVYTNLITVDYPDQITGGLRRTTDALRAVLERTRGDLTITVRQRQLERALRERVE